jgi:hypothetical protein
MLRVSEVDKLMKPALLYLSECVVVVVGSSNLITVECSKFPKSLSRLKMTSHLIVMRHCQLPARVYQLPRQGLEK